MPANVTGALPAQAATVDLVRHVCALDDVPFETTADVPADAGAFGQARALEALELATAIPSDGYNVYATGVPGTGRRTMLGDWLRERAAARPAPPDIVQLCNFADPLRPHAVSLPAGSAKALADDVSTLVDAVRRGLRKAFESDSYRAQHRKLHEQIDHRRENVLRELDARAREAGVAIQLTPAGAITVPISGGRPLQPDEVQAMPEPLRATFEEAVDALKEPVADAFATMHDLDHELHERHRALNREVAVFAIGHLVERAQRRWAHTPRIVTWLEGLRDDAIENLELLRAGPDEDETTPGPVLPGLPQAAPVDTVLVRYAVNVLVTHDPDGGAPVVVAIDPSFYDLFGRVEYETAFGAATTDHRHLRSGLVHQAAGGFLVLQAADVLSKPLVWPRLKEVLRTGRLRIENVAVQYMLFPGVTLDAEPADVRLTVVLVGPTELYQLLHALDEDFSRLFKVRADFAPDVPRDEAGIRGYAGLLARVARERGLLPFDRGAIGALVEYGSRLAGHRDRLSTQARELTDVATEAAHLANGTTNGAVGAEQIAAALRARRRRSDLIEQELRDQTLEGTVKIDVSGLVIGQVNGLAVALLGDHEFGHPVRITATVAPGEGEVVDIDREARLSGPVHAKGVLILSGFLAGRYFLDRPMALRASIVFEQSYGPVEGDSASTAELLALLSALGGLPVRQSVAITGAVDQHGAVHAVGGINEKIEGFFDLCDARGLTGDQGVVIPESNLKHLMLDVRVVDAVRDGRFAIWPVRTVDEALDRVTGEPSADARIRDRLEALAQASRDGHRSVPT